MPRSIRTTARRSLQLLCCAAAVFVLAGACRAGESAGAAAARAWIEPLFRHSQFSRPALSPDGKLIGVLVPGGERVVLELMDLKERAAWVLVRFDDADVIDFQWINDHRLVVFAADLKSGSAENCWCGFYAVNTDRSHFLRFGFRGRKLYRYAASYDDGSDDVLVTTREYDESLDAFRLNTITKARRSLVYGLPHRATDLKFDHRMRLRALMVDSADARRTAVWYRDDLDSPWIVLGDFDITRVGFKPVGFSADDRTMYVSSTDADGEEALFAYDVEQRRLGEQLLARRGFDVEGDLIFARGSHELLGARVEGDRPETVWFDRDAAQAQARVDAALPHTLNELSGDPRGTMVAFAHSDTDPGRYYLYDARTQRLEELFRARPWIEPELMSPMRPLRYRARDGLEIPAYLTLPKGRPAADLPLVALIHGGPWLRDHWGFEPQVQYLAALGYAVLQPNYRGSAGFGARHLQAGWRNWGLAMQDDITDGVEFLAAQGLVDRRRVCIMGASYGGYAALMGLVKEPGLFRCGIDVSGPSDIGLKFTAWSDYSDSIWQRYGMRQLVGDPDTMSEQLALTSPLQQAGRIKAPVLIVHGEKDWRVPIEHATRMRDALERRHATYEWLELPGEGHGFLKWENQVRYHETVAQFLRRYNPAD